MSKNDKISTELCSDNLVNSGNKKSRNNKKVEVKSEGAKSNT